MLINELIMLFLSVIHSETCMKSINILIINQYEKKCSEEMVC